MSLPTFAAMLEADLHAPLLVHARAQKRAASEAERRAAERKMRRLMLGSCECGEVAGEAWCLHCDGGLPRVGAVSRRERVEEVLREVERAVVTISAIGPRPPNRHERRARRSRRWRG